MAGIGVSQLAERLSEAANYAFEMSDGEGPFHRLYVFKGGIAVRSHFGVLNAEHRVSFLDLEQCVVNPLIQAVDHNAALLKRSAEQE